MRHRKKRTKSRKNWGGGSREFKRNLLISLILYEKIKTTKAKAKFIRPEIEKLITLSKTKSLATKKRLHQLLNNKNAEKKVREVLATRYKERKGGYTRINFLGQRQGDKAKLVQIELV